MKKILRKIENIIMIPVAKLFFKIYELLTKMLGTDWGASDEDY